MCTLTSLGHHVAVCAVDLPTVGSYCEEYGLMFRSLPRALYIGLQDRGAVSTLVPVAVLILS